MRVNATLKLPFKFCSKKAIWLRENNIKHFWTGKIAPDKTYYSTIYFENELDAIHFSLRWL